MVMRFYVHIHACLSPNLALLRLFQTFIIKLLSFVFVSRCDAASSSSSIFLALLKLYCVSVKCGRWWEGVRGMSTRSHLISILRLLLIVPMWGKWMGFHLCNDLSPSVNTPTDPHIVGSHLTEGANTSAYLQTLQYASTWMISMTHGANNYNNLNTNI